MEFGDSNQKIHFLLILKPSALSERRLSKQKLLFHDIAHLNRNKKEKYKLASAMLQCALPFTCRYLTYRLIWLARESPLGTTILTFIHLLRVGKPRYYALLPKYRNTT